MIPGGRVNRTARRIPSPEEQEALRRANVFAAEDKTGPDAYPRMYNLSAGFMFNSILRADTPAPPEYVTLPHRHGGSGDLAWTGAVGRWNCLWESAQFRRRHFDESELPAEVAKIADTGDNNVVFVPRTRTRYHEYAPLFHLLPAATLRRYGLPLLVAGQWPFTATLADLDNYLPADFESRLARAWASTVWRCLSPGSPLTAFGGDEPIRLLAHNLDFWLPAVTEVMQDRLSYVPEVNNGIESVPAILQDGSVLHGAHVGNPRKGSDIWRGEADAETAVAETVEYADSTGRLRDILDAVRAHRLADDFSDRWSFAKEDFERKLHRKRAKVKVTFVELTDTVPVQSPETEVIGSMVCADFMALLDPRDRHIVVLLNSGVTRMTEVASILGYANHSAVSKRLNRIRVQAERFFGDR